MLSHPRLPQCLIFCVLMQKTCQLVHVVYHPVPALQIAKYMEGVKCQIVDRAKRGVTKVACVADDSPAPKLIHARYGKPCRCEIPEAEVYVDARRHFRVIGISTPSPRSLSGHLGQMVRGKLL